MRDHIWLGRRLERALRRTRQVVGAPRLRVRNDPFRRPREALEADRARAREHERRAWRTLVAEVGPPPSQDPVESDPGAMARVRASGLVDAEWYRAQTGGGVEDPVGHYLEHGSQDGLDPNPLFDTAWYRRTYAARLAPHDEPLVHYLSTGHRDGCAPSAGVDLEELRLRLGTGEAEPLRTLLWLLRTVDAPAFQASLEQERTPATPRDDTELRWRDLVTGVSRVRDTFVLYRIIGNDLPPRHGSGQSERSLRFVLEHEPDLEGCEKRYVLNRILDHEVERRLVQLLEQHGASYLRIPFDSEVYRSIGWRTSDFPRRGTLAGPEAARLDEVSRARAFDHAYHDKNLYVMHNNGARNVALEDGRVRARWILPFDGNCFFTGSAWATFRDGVLAAPHRRYALVPMARVTDNTELQRDAVTVGARDEPQIAFRHDAPAAFHTDQRYGRRPKVELLHRLGVPGPWDLWPDEPWEDPWPPRAAEAGEYHWAGWVARLTSGRPHLEADESRRMVERMQAVRRCLQQVDAAVIADRYDPATTLLRDPEVLEHQRATPTMGGHRLTDLIADEVSTTTEPGALAEARTAAGLARQLTTTTIAGWLLQNDAMLDHAAHLADRCFASTSQPSPRRPWPGLDQVLDALRLLDHAQRLDDATKERARTWTAAHRTWLSSARPPRSATGRELWPDVGLLASLAYLGEMEAVAGHLPIVAERRHEFLERWHGPRRLSTRPTSRRRAMSGLQALVRLDTIGRRLGLTLDDTKGPGPDEALRNLVVQAAPPPDASRQVLERQLYQAGTSTEPSPPPLLPVPHRVPGLPPLWWAGLG